MSRLRLFTHLVLAALATGCTASVGTPPAAYSEGSTFDAGECVNIAPTGADLACATDEDCTVIQGGRVCAMPCCGGDAAVNKDAAARLAAAETVTLFPQAGVCGSCEASAMTGCVRGQCVVCGPSGCGDGGVAVTDAAATRRDAIATAREAGGDATRR
jgi:hypothetical protein